MARFLRSERALICSCLSAVAMAAAWAQTPPAGPAPQEILRVAVISMKTADGDTARALRSHEEWIERAASAGARFVGFPARSLTGSRPESALTLDSPPIGRLKAVARERGLHVAAGLLERHENALYDTVVLIGPSGIAGVARRISLIGGEDKPLTGWNKLPVFDLGIACVGVAIGPDSWYMETSRILAVKGSDFIFAPWHSAPPGFGEDWPATLNKRMAQIASLVRIPVVAVNVLMPKPSEGALAVDASGKILAATSVPGAEGTMIIADLKIGPIQPAARRYPEELQIARYYGNLLMPSMPEFENAAPATEEPIGLIGHWPFDDGKGTEAAEATGRNRRAILLGGATWCEGPMRGAIRLDGKEASALIPRSRNLNLGTSDFTISLRIKPYKAGGQLLWGNFHLFYDRGGTALTFRSSGGGPENRLDVVPKDGVWTHLVVMRKNGELTFFLDGAPHRAGSNPSDFTLHADWNLYVPLIVGRGFAGEIDDLRLYTRAVAPEQIPRP